MPMADANTRARSEAVRHPAADGNENRQAQRVTGQHRLHARGATCRAAAMVGTAVFRIVVSSDSMKNATAIIHGSNRCAASDSTGGERG